MEDIGLFLCSQEHVTGCCLNHINTGGDMDSEGEVFCEKVNEGNEDNTENEHAAYSTVSVLVINWHAQDCHRLDSIINVKCLLGSKS